MPSLLVVDDEPLNLEIITEFLSDQGYELVTAHDGVEACGLLEARPAYFDAIILDRVMPKMDGMEVLHRIKTDAGLKDLPVIMQTSASAPEQVAEGLAAGAWYYLAKPYRGEALRSIVRSALDDKKNRQELIQLGKAMQEALALAQYAQFRFRTLAEVRLLAATLARLCPNESSVAIGLMELMLNAVEHGNLGINYSAKSQLLEQGIWEEEIARRLASPDQTDRWATLELSHDGHTLHFKIRDQGQGFDWQRFMELDPSRAFDSHGRGIAMARLIAFSSLEYMEQGNVVKASVKLQS